MKNSLLFTVLLSTVLLISCSGNNEKIDNVSSDTKVIETEKSKESKAPIDLYLEDAKNAKILSDLELIPTIMLIKESEGVPYEEMIIRNTDNEIKDAAFDNYIAGTFNYEKLGINKENFSHPGDSEYLVGYTSSGGGEYQIAAKYYKDGKYIVKTAGSYNPKTAEDESEGLIVIDGKILVDGDDYPE